MENKKKYGIFRIEKVKLCDGGEIMGRLKHAFREFENDSFDPELTKTNDAFLLGSAKEVMNAYKARIQEITTEQYKPPKNAVGIFECIFTSTAGAISKEREQEFFYRTYNQLCITFGKDNILAGTVHRDETTVHTHWFVMPVFNTTSVLRRTREEKRKGTCRTITQLKLNATHWTGSPASMSKLQDTMWKGVFQYLGLERGEVESTAGRTKKKKNIRSNLMFREKELSEKQQALTCESEWQEQNAEKLENFRKELVERDKELKKQRTAFLKEKFDFQSEMSTASQRAIEKYEKLKDSESFQKADFPQLPSPELRENTWYYHLRIRSLFDAVVYKAQQFFEQIKCLQKKHQDEIQKLKEEHKADIEAVKENAEAENKKAIEKAVQVKAEEKDVTINSLKQEIQMERTEKERWYTALFKKFSMKIGDSTVEMNQGLTEAYIDKDRQLAEWENRNGDELISLGTNYKKFHVFNWKDYLKAKSRPRSVDYGISR